MLGGELWVGPWHWDWGAVDRSSEIPEKVCVMLFFKVRTVYVWACMMLHGYVARVHVYVSRTWILCVELGYVCRMCQGSVQWCVYSGEFWHIRKLLIKGF